MASSNRADNCTNSQGFMDSRLLKRADRRSRSLRCGKPSGDDSAENGQPAAKSEEIRSGLECHLEQTKCHVERLEEIFESLGEKPTGKTCAGIAGLVKEG